MSSTTKAPIVSEQFVRVVCSMRWEMSGQPVQNYSVSDSVCRVNILAECINHPACLLILEADCSSSVCEEQKNIYDANIVLSDVLNFMASKKMSHHDQQTFYCRTMYYKFV